MTKPTQKAEVMLEVVGAGGGYTILGAQHNGHWRFWRDPGDGDSWMWDDDVPVVDDLPKSLPKPAPEPRINCYSSFDEALETMNSCWPTLFPIRVHPIVAAHVWEKVDAYKEKNSDHVKRGYVLKWKALCLK